MMKQKQVQLVKCPYNGCDGACPYWVEKNGCYYCYSDMRPNCVVDRDEEEEES